MIGLLLGFGIDGVLPCKAFFAACSSRLLGCIIAKETLCFFGHHLTVNFFNFELSSLFSYRSHNLLVGNQHIYINSTAPTKLILPWFRRPGADSHVEASRIAVGVDESGSAPVILHTELYRSPKLRVSTPVATRERSNSYELCTT